MQHPSPSSDSPRRKRFPYWLVLMMLDIVFIVVLNNMTSAQKVYTRNVMFSHIYADNDITDESTLNRHILDGFKRDADTRNYLPFLNQTKAERLRLMASQAGMIDARLAEEIGRSVGDISDSKVCGIESIGKIVFDVERGIGCCSDISKAWIFYALYIGLQVREVSLFNHTTVEFFDRQTRQWVWLDSMHGVQITDTQGTALSQYKIRRSNFFAPRVVKRFDTKRENFSADTYVGYDPAQYGVIMWRKGVNFLELDRWHTQLQKLGLSKNVRQFILLTFNIHPGWLILATDPTAYYLHVLKTCIVVAMSLMIVLHAFAACMLIRARRVSAKRP